VDRNLERNVDYAKDGIDALVQEIERLESLVEELQNEISAKESKIEELEEIIVQLSVELL